MIKLVTDQKHRFNKSILIKGQEFFVNDVGQIEVEEPIVTFALDVGFELVNKNQTFTSKEEQSKIEEVQSIINGAKETAKEIIESAKCEAAEIIAKAKVEANSILNNSEVGEQKEFVLKLQNKKVDELREVAVSAELYSSEEVKGMKKQDLIDAIVKARFSHIQPS